MKKSVLGTEGANSEWKGTKKEKGKLKDHALKNVENGKLKVSGSDYNWRKQRTRQKRLQTELAVERTRSKEKGKEEKKMRSPQIEGRTSQWWAVV